MSTFVDPVMLADDVKIDVNGGDCLMRDKIYSKIGGNGNKNVVINRAWYTKSSFDVVGDYEKRKVGCKEKVGRLCSSCCPMTRDAWKSRIFSLFPFINILRSYTKNNLFCDAIAGLTVGVMHIPQGMAYGILANIDPVYGLYTSFFSIFIYFIFGTSKHISIGVFAVVSLMIGSVVDKAECLGGPASYSFSNDSAVLYEPNATQFYFEPTSVANFPNEVTNNEVERCKVQHALTVTFIAGVVQLLMGAFHFGFVTVYLSDPLTRGLITGAGVHVFTSQIKHVFGISIGRYNGPFKLVYLYKNFFEEIKNTNPAPLVASLVCIVIIYCLQRWVSPKMKKCIKVPLPAELLVLILGTLLSHFLKFSSPSVFSMKVVGQIPTGIPIPQPPNLFLIPKLVLDAIAIAVVTFTVNISMAKMFSVKHGYKLDSNQELVAYGMTNLIGSCFNSYVSAASLSRSLVQESTGGKTQVASLIASILLLVVLLFIGPLFRDLPNCILAAVIIVNLRGIFMQVLDLKYLRRISTADALTWVVTCTGVILSDVDLGLVVGLSFSFLTVVVRNQTPKVHELGNIPGTELYGDIKDYKKAIEVDGIKIFSLGTSLFYANAEHFQETLLEWLSGISTKTNEVQPTNIYDIEKSMEHDEKELGEPETEQGSNLKGKAANEDHSHVVIDCSQMSFVDDVGIKTLNTISFELRKKAVKLSLAHCCDGVNHTLRKAMDLGKLEKCQFFCTNHDAVKCLSHCNT